MFVKFMKIAWKWKGNKSKGLDLISDEREKNSQKGSMFDPFWDKREPIS